MGSSRSAVKMTRSPREIADFEGWEEVAIGDGRG